MKSMKIGKIEALKYEQTTQIESLNKNTVMSILVFTRERERFT